MKILLTGAPGVGKSTVLSRFLDRYEGRYSGVLAHEIRDTLGERVGFEAVRTDGEARVFAHKHRFADSPHLIGGKYHVDISAIDEFVVPEICRAARLRNTLVVIDEIGRMQACSPRFLATVSTVLNSNCDLLATIVADDEPWARPSKSHPDVCVLSVNLANRNTIVTQLISMFRT